jgi:hypothetical protein
MAPACREVIATTAARVIHRRAVGEDCTTDKPQLVCSCGVYEIAWEPPPTCSLAPQWERWKLEGWDQLT